MVQHLQLLGRQAALERQQSLEACSLQAQLAALSDVHWPPMALAVSDQSLLNTASCTTAGQGMTGVPANAAAASGSQSAYAHGLSTTKPCRLHGSQQSQPEAGSQADQAAGPPHAAAAACSSMQSAKSASLAAAARLGCQMENVGKSSKLQQDGGAQRQVMQHSAMSAVPEPAPGSAATALTAGAFVPAAAAAGEALLSAQKEAADTFAVIAATHQVIPTVPAGRLYGGCVLVGCRAKMQDLVQLQCPGVNTLLNLTKDSSGHTHNPAIELDVVDTGPLPTYSQEVYCSLQASDMRDWREMAPVLLTRSGLRQALSMLGPAALQRRLVRALDVVIRGKGGLRGWFWEAHAMFLQEWGAPACCPKQEFQSAALVLQQCVVHRVRFARLLLAAHELLQHSQGVQHSRACSSSSSSRR